MLHIGRGETQFKTTILRLKRTRGAGNRADLEFGIGGKIGLGPGCIGLGVKTVDAECADHDVARRGIAIDHRHTEQVLCCQRYIRRGNMIAIDLDAFGIGGDGGILAAVIGVKRDVGIGGTGCFCKHQSCGGGNIRRVKLQRAGQETFRVLDHIARKMRATSVKDKIGQALFVIDDIDQASKFNTLTIEESAARKLAGKSGTCLCIAVE